MSDLTITTAGQSESKVSGGEFLSSEKKLNQMKVVLTEAVKADCDTSPNYAAGDLFFNPIKVSNIVGVKGGSGIIQSVVATSNDALSAGFDIVVSTSNGSIGDDEDDRNDALSSETPGDAIIQAVQGVISINTMIPTNDRSFGSASNCGLAIQAAEGTRDMYIWGIARGSLNIGDADGLSIRLGVIQD